MDITGLVAVTFIFGGGTAVLLAMGPIGRAIADRIRGVAGGEVAGRLDRLQELQEGLLEEVDGLRGEVADLQERLDFTERLIASPHQPERLPGSEDVHK